MTKILKRNRNGNISFISPLYQWAAYCLQTPRYDFKQKKARNNSRFKLATALYILALIIALATTGYAKYMILLVEPMVSNTTKLIDSTLLLFQLITCILVSSSVLFETEDITLFIKTFEMLDARLNIDEENRGMYSYNFATEIVVIHLLLFCTYAYDAYVWICEMSFAFYSSLLLRSFLFYPYVLFCLIVWNFVLAIKVRFKLLNKHLKRHVFAPSNPSNFDLKLYVIGNSKQVHDASISKKLSVKDIMKLHGHLRKLVALFNTIYGMKIVCMTVIFILGALMAISLGLLYGVPGNFMDFDYGVHLLVVCTSLWPAVTLVCN